MEARYVIHHSTSINRLMREFMPVFLYHFFTWKNDRQISYCILYRFRSDAINKLRHLLLIKFIKYFLA